MPGNLSPCRLASFCGSGINLLMPIICRSICLLYLVSGLFFGIANVRAELRAGAAVVDATPTEFPVIVNGGMTQREAAAAVTPINVRAVAVDDGKTRLAILVVDSCMMPRALLDEAKRLAERRTGVRADRIFISATHSHTAPASMGCLGTSVDPRYPTLLKQKLAEAVEKSVANLVPAECGVGIVDANEFTALRRWVRRPDKMLSDPFGNLTVRANMHPGFLSEDAIGETGPEDPDLALISFRRPDGSPIAVIANFSMHYHGGIPALNADYFGIFNEELARRVMAERAARGPEFVSMLGHGCSGDIYLRDYAKPAPKEKTSIDDYTRALVDRAMIAWKAIRYRGDLSIAMAEAKLPLRYRTPDKQRLEWARRVVSEMGDRLPKSKEEIYAREAILLDEAKETELVLQAIRIGDIGITGIPNEVYALTGLKQKAFSPLRPTITFDLANGAEGYIPPPEQHPLGGYNTWDARTAGLEVMAEPKIVEVCLQLLEQVSGKTRVDWRQTMGDAAGDVVKAEPAAYWRLDELSGPRATDRVGSNDGIYEPGVLFWLEGARNKAFAGDREKNRATHFAGGRMRARIDGLGDRYSLSMWFWNGMPIEARGTAGWMFSRGWDHSLGAMGEHLGVAGSKGEAGRILFSTGDGGEALHGTTRIARWTWHHVALVRDGASVAVYLDGVKEIDARLRRAVSPGVDQIFIGGRNDQRDGWEGKLDEVAVFKRALRAEEIRRLSAGE
jgi:hypothetical protein